MWWGLEVFGRTWSVGFITAYSLSGVLLGVASLASHAFGSPETRRKTQVMIAGTVLGLLPIMLINVMILM
jgi:hypothetical protein